MEFSKVFEAIEDALRNKDILIDVYKREGDQLREEVVSLRKQIANMEEARANAD